MGYVICNDYRSYRMREKSTKWVDTIKKESRKNAVKQETVKLILPVGSTQLKVRGSEPLISHWFPQM